MKHFDGGIIYGEQFTVTDPSVKNQKDPNTKTTVHGFITKNLNVLEWPDQSPDLNVTEIENLLTVSIQSDRAILPRRMGDSGSAYAKLIETSSPSSQKKHILLFCWKLLQIRLNQEISCQYAESLQHHTVTLQSQFLQGIPTSFHRPAVFYFKYPNWYITVAKKVVNFLYQWQQ